MAYQRPAESDTTAPQPVKECGPTMVTPLSKVGAVAVDVDCPYCERVVKSEPREVAAGDDG